MAENRDILAALEEALACAGEAWLPASGVSMGRRFTGADALLVRRADATQVRPGSVVVVRSGPDRWVAHRVIWKQTRGSACRMVTKGDGRIEADWPVREAEDLVGEVVGVRRAGVERRHAGRGSQWAGRARALGGLLIAVGWEGVRWLSGRGRSWNARS